MPFARRLGPALGKQQGVTRAVHVHHALVRHHGLDRFHALRQLGAGEDEVRRAQPVDEPLQLGQGRVHRVGERGQHLEDQRLLLPLDLDQLVVVVDHRLRLHEERRPALAAIVHDAPEARLGAREHRQHVAPVAHGDVALLEEELRARLLEESLQPLDQRPPQLPQPPPQPAQLGAGLVPDGAVLVQRAAEEIAQGPHRGEAAEGRPSSGATGAMLRP